MTRRPRRGTLFTVIGGLIVAMALGGCGVTLQPDSEVPHNAPGGGQTQAEFDAVRPRPDPPMQFRGR